MVSKGSGFRGVLNYVFDEGNANGKDAEAFAGNMFGETPRQLAKEFGVTRSMRPRAKETVLHFSMSLPPGEHLSKQDWMKASKTLLEGYGLDTEKNQWVAVMHNDTEHEHVHIVASRISIDGELVDTFRDYKRVHGAMREIEKEFGLAEVNSPAEKSPERKSFTRAEAKMLDAGKTPMRAVLQATCSRAKEQAKTFREYADLLAAENIEVKLNQSQTTGRISGISYCLGGVAFKGSDLGKGFSIAGVQAALEGNRNEQERNVGNSNSKERGRSIAGSEIPMSFFRRIMFRGVKYALLYHIILKKQNDVLDEQDFGWAGRVCALHLRDVHALIKMHGGYEDFEGKLRAAKSVIEKKKKQGKEAAARDLVAGSRKIKDAGEAKDLLGILKD